MFMKFQRPKGTKDLFPEERSIHNKLVQIFQKVTSRYNFNEIETPAFEHFDLLSSKSGPELAEQIFMLKKRGDEEFALRPEYTASTARMFIDIQKEAPKPIKWSYSGRLWRYEAPQKGRLREFYQLGVELFGSKSPLADAEVISVIVDFFKELKVTSKEVKVKVNNRKILQGILTEMVGEKKLDEALRLIDKKKKLTKAQFAADCELLNIKEIIPILEITKLEELDGLNLNELSTEGVEELRKVLDFTDNKFVEFDVSIIRGLGYYTGTIFEAVDANGKLRSLCGGGRYDDMIESFGGEKCPATGMAIGTETLTLYLTELERLPEVDTAPDYFIAAISESVLPAALKIAKKLRKKHSVEIEMMKRSLGKQLNYASAINAKKAIIIGEKDLAEKKVTVRDLESGKEEKVKLDSF